MKPKEIVWKVNFPRWTVANLIRRHLIYHTKNSFGRPQKVTKINGPYPSSKSEKTYLAGKKIANLIKQYIDIDIYSVSIRLSLIMFAYRSKMKRKSASNSYNEEEKITKCMSLSKLVHCK